jgi:predicted PurR-regulated permease PerM
VNTPLSQQDNPQVIPDRTGWWTRDHALVVVLVIATALLFYLCWQIIKPFLSPIAWALALGVVARPVHCWISERVAKPWLSAGLAVLIIAAIIIAPAVFVGHQIVKQGAATVGSVQETMKDGKWREEIAKKSPQLHTVITAAEQNGGFSGQVQTMAGDAAKYFSKIVTGSAWAVVELLLTLFVLFFIFRDRGRATHSLRSLVPLSEKETDEVIKRVSDTIHATIYGTLVVALVQGALGGLMFWWLGLPAPILWGAVMALLAIVPVLGAFVVWVPAAIFLAMNGEMGKALILTVWGGVVVSLIDNLLYPILVGNRLRMHTVPVFFAIVGGLMFFGAVGLVLGPVVLALTIAAIDIWRRRTAMGQAAESAVSTAPAASLPTVPSS